MRRRLHHWKDVFKRAFTVAGWVAGLVTVLAGGSIVAAGGFLLHERHRTFAVAIVAAGVLVALLEGSYRVWDATEKDLQATRGRLRELDTEEAKRAYLDEQIAKAERLQQRIEFISRSGQWDFRTRRTSRSDIAHWEDGVRADLREWFADGIDLLFDSDEGFVPGGSTVGSSDTDLEYLGWRIARLRQIKENL